MLKSSSGDCLRITNNFIKYLKDVCIIFINISLLNIFSTILSLEIFIENNQVFGHCTYRCVKIPACVFMKLT